MDVNFAQALGNIVKSCKMETYNTFFSSREDISSQSKEHFLERAILS